MQNMINGKLLIEYFFIILAKLFAAWTWWLRQSQDIWEISNISVKSIMCPQTGPKFDLFDVCVRVIIYQEIILPNCPNYMTYVPRFGKSYIGFQLFINACNDFHITGIIMNPKVPMQNKLN